MIDELIDGLITEMKNLNKLIPVCSFKDCRKVRLYDDWFKATYDLNYNNYSHTICNECKVKHYDNIRQTNNRKYDKG